MEIAERLEESLPGRIEPDTLLPCQFHELMRRRQTLEGERRLMFAVLADGVDCYLKNMNAALRKQRVLFYEARLWINAKNKVGLFAFETLCESFGINASALRGALEQRRLRHEAGSIRPSFSSRRRPARRLSTNQEGRGRGRFAK